MGTTLTGTKPKDTYDSLIKVTDNGPIGATAKYLSDGLGNDSVLALSNARVGVGKIPDTYRFDLDSADGNIARFSFLGANATFDISAPTTNTIRIGAASGDVLGLVAGGAEAVRITADGNVGIGTSTPTSAGVNSALRVKQASDAASGFTGLGIETAAGTGELLYFGNTGTTAIIGQTYLGGGGAYQPIAFSVGGSERFRVTSSGVTFNGDTAAANALDDYEEGTWTGTLRGSVSDPTTAVTATGRYTKIGRVVTVEIQMDAKDTTGASGGVTVTGLPFTSAVEAQGAMMSDLYTFGVLCTASNCFVSPFSTTLTFFTTGSNASWASLTHNAGTPRSLRGTVTYFV